MPLDYRVPREERRRLQLAIPLIGGVAGGAAMVGCAGAGLFIAMYGNRPHLTSRVPMIVWAAIALLSTVAGIRLIRRRHARGVRWFEIGVLLGIGISALVEGVCFTSP